MGKRDTSFERGYYLYRHIRLDKNEPFYIGIGTKRKHNNYETVKSEYYRAYITGNKRSIFWNSIVKKSDYKVDILFETTNSNLILEKEKEFIKLYGRKDLNLGPLVNLTDGGEFNTNVLMTEEKREKSRKSSKKGKDNYLSIPIYRYSDDGVFINRYESISEASKDNNVTPGAIRISIRCKTKSVGYYFSKNYYKNSFKDNVKVKTEFYNWNKDREKNLPRFTYKVEAYNLDGSFYREFNNTMEALEYLNIPLPKLKGMNHITRTCLGHRKHGYGFIWKYKKDIKNEN